MKQKYLFFSSTERCSHIISYSWLAHKSTEFNGTQTFHLDGTSINAMDQNLPVSEQVLPLTSGRIWKAQGPFEHRKKIMDKINKYVTSWKLEMFLRFVQ